MNMSGDFNQGQKSNTILVVIIAIIVTALIVGEGVYIWQKNNNQKQIQQIIGLQEEVAQLQQKQIETNKIVDSQNTQQDVESGIVSKKNEINQGVDTIAGMANWKTYKNDDYGYSIKYPKEWILEEVSIPSAINEKLQLKYVGIKSSNAKDDHFALYIGIKNKNQDNISINGRTGVGVSTIVDGSISLGDKYNVKVKMGKELVNVIEIIGENTLIDDMHIVNIEIGYMGKEYPGGVNFDLTETSEYKIIEKILSTFKFND